MNKKRIIGFSALMVGVGFAVSMPAYAHFSENHEHVSSTPAGLTDAPLTEEVSKKVAAQTPTFKQGEEDTSFVISNPSNPYAELRNQERPVYVPEEALPEGSWNLDNGYTEDNGHTVDVPVSPTPVVPESVSAPQPSSSVTPLETNVTPTIPSEAMVVPEPVTQ